MVWERAVLLFWAHRWIDCEWGRRISSGATAGRLQGVYFWHTFDPRPLLLGSSTLSSQPPHKRALCMSARICQTKLYSIAPPPRFPEPWHEHRSTRCRKQRSCCRKRGPERSQKSDGNISPALSFSRIHYPLLPPL